MVMVKMGRMLGTSRVTYMRSLDERGVVAGKGMRKLWVKEGVFAVSRSRKGGGERGGLEPGGIGKCERTGLT